MNQSHESIARGVVAQLLDALEVRADRRMVVGDKLFPLVLSALRKENIAHAVTIQFMDALEMPLEARLATGEKLLPILRSALAIMEELNHRNCWLVRRLIGGHDCSSN